MQTRKLQSLKTCELRQFGRERLSDVSESKSSREAANTTLLIRRGRKRLCRELQGKSAGKIPTDKKAAKNHASLGDKAKGNARECERRKVALRDARQRQR